MHGSRPNVQQSRLVFSLSAARIIQTYITILKALVTVTMQKDRYAQVDPLSDVQQS